jgi:hypothetical protein
MAKALAIKAVCGALLASVVANCAGVPTLSQAELAQVGLATPDEEARLQAAKDAYRDEQKPRIRLKVTVIQPDWPILWVTFRSAQQLFNPLEAGERYASVYLCSLRDEEVNARRLARESILWRDRIVGQKAARQIAEELRAGAAPQEYKVFFRYMNWDRTAPRQNGDPITLVSLEEDLCLSLKKINDPFAPSIGEPLRIDKEAVNAAVGTLPRSLPVPELPPRADPAS